MCIDDNEIFPDYEKILSLSFTVYEKNFIKRGRKNPNVELFNFSIQFPFCFFAKCSSFGVINGLIKGKIHIF
jgi:hypothetical protein